MVANEISIGVVASSALAQKVKTPLYAKGQRRCWP
jgi:hypothetical protein